MFKSHTTDSPSSPLERDLLALMRVDARVIRARSLQACISAADIDPTARGEARKKQIRKSATRRVPRHQPREDFDMARLTKRQRELRAEIDRRWAARTARIAEHSRRECVLMEAIAWCNGREKPNFDDYHEAFEEL